MTRFSDDAAPPWQRGLSATLSAIVVGGPLLALTWHWAGVMIVASPAAPAVFEVQSLASPPDTRELPPGPERTEQRKRPVVPPDTLVEPEAKLLQPTEPARDRVAELAVDPPDPGPAAPEATAPPRLVAPPAPRAASGAATWEGRLLAHLQKYRRYPAKARAMRQQGTVFVLFRMSREGQVIDAQIARPSGFPALDRAALETLRRAQPLPAIPDDRPGELSLTVPVEFLLS